MHSAGKESKAAGEYRKSYNRVMPAAWKLMPYLTKGTKGAGFKVVLIGKRCSSRPSWIGPGWLVCY